MRKRSGSYQGNGSKGHFHSKVTEGGFDRTVCRRSFSPWKEIEKNDRSNQGIDAKSKDPTWPFLQTISKISTQHTHTIKKKKTLPTWRLLCFFWKSLLHILKSIRPIGNVTEAILIRFYRHRPKSQMMTAVRKGKPEGKLRNKTAYPGSLIDRYYTGDVRVSFDFRSLLFYSWTRRWLTISNFPCIADGQDTPSQFDWSPRPWREKKKGNLTGRVSASERERGRQYTTTRTYT